MKGVFIRNAVLDDAERVFRWRNLPEIVELSELRKVVTWKEHKKWFEGALQDDDHFIFIIVSDNSDVGLIRFQRKGDQCDVSIYLTPGNEKKGIGSRSFLKACQLMQKECERFGASIRSDNLVSLAFFKKHGFSMAKKSNSMHYCICEDIKVNG